MKNFRNLFVLLMLLSTTSFLVAQDDEPGTATDESSVTDDEATPNPAEPEADAADTTTATDDTDSDAATDDDSDTETADADDADDSAPAPATNKNSADMSVKWYKNPNKPIGDYLVFEKGPAKKGRRVLFGTGKYLYSKSDKPKFHYVIKKLEGMPKYGVLVSGHTDHIGTYKENIGLSYKRAATIRNGLVLHGLDPSRIKIVGHSFKHQVYKNATSNAKRARNRRVIMKILPLSQLFPIPPDYFVK